MVNYPSYFRGSLNKVQSLLSILFNVTWSDCCLHMRNGVVIEKRKDQRPAEKAVENSSVLSLGELSLVCVCVCGALNNKHQDHMLTECFAERN